MEGRLTNHILAVRGSTLWNTLQSQNLSLITTNLNSYCHEAFSLSKFCWIEPNTQQQAVFCISSEANIIASVVSDIQQIKFKRFDSKPSDGREAPLRSRRSFHATNEKRRNYNGSKVWCVNANVRKKQLHHRSNSRRAPS